MADESWKSDPESHSQSELSRIGKHFYAPVVGVLGLGNVSYNYTNGM